MTIQERKEYLKMRNEKAKAMLQHNLDHIDITSYIIPESLAKSNLLDTALQYVSKYTSEANRDKNDSRNTISSIIKWIAG